MVENTIEARPEITQVVRDAVEIVLGRPGGEEVIVALACLGPERAGVLRVYEDGGAESEEIRTAAALSRAINQPDPPSRAIDRTDSPPSGWCGWRSSSGPVWAYLPADLPATTAADSKRALAVLDREYGRGA